MPRNIATDLGIFDNYITKETWKVSQKDTIDRLLPAGPEAEAEPRPVGRRVSPEAAQPQDSVSWVYKGEHSRVWRNRLFTDVKVNLFGYDFPLGVKADYKTQPPRLDTGTNFTQRRRVERVRPGPAEAAGDGAADLLRAGQRWAATT